jgi:sugar lactone lactonase YvrE
VRYSYYSLPIGLAVDAVGNLYVSDTGDGGRIQKRDALGSWSVIAATDTGLGGLESPNGLAVDAAGNLYVADSGNERVQKYTPDP